MVVLIVFEVIVFVAHGQRGWREHFAKNQSNSAIALCTDMEQYTLNT